MAPLRRLARPIPRLLAGTDEPALLHNDIIELPDLPSFVERDVALVGDAAHAMTPNLGQGACQALEDAVVLGRCLDDPASGLAAYDRIRRPRSQFVAARSRRTGRLAQLDSPAAAALRNTLLRRTPSAVMTRSLVRILDWQP